MNRFAFVFVIAAAASVGSTQAPQQTKAATDLIYDIYDGCLKDFSTSCIQPKAIQWFNEALSQNEVQITDQLSIVSTTAAPVIQKRAFDPQEQMFDDIDNYLATHALKVKAPEFFNTIEARSYVPDFLMDNALTKDSIVPLTPRSAIEGRGFIRKAVLPFLLGLKFKTAVMVPLALAMIALKTWKAMTLGLLSLVLSGALVLFKIAKPKIVNYEVVHYPHHHVEHVEHVPHHHVEHIVPHHLEHHVEHIVPHHVEHFVPHHLDHHVEHLEIPHHVDHIEHLEHDAPAWDPHAWSRSSQEPKDAHDMAFAGQNRR